MRLDCPCVPCGVVLSVTVEAPLCVDWSCPLTDIVTTSADSCELLTLASSSCQAPSLLFGADAIANLRCSWCIYPWLYAFACTPAGIATQLPRGRSIPRLHSFCGISSYRQDFVSAVAPPAGAGPRFVLLEEAQSPRSARLQPHSLLPHELFGRSRSSMILRKVRDTLAPYLDGWPRVYHSLLLG